jgi:dTMP kinase
MGKYIVVEGPDGCGKSTAARRIADTLRRNNREVLHTAHPGATPLGQEIRKLTKHRYDIEIDRYTEQLLMLCDNSAFIKSVLEPALAEDKVVIADRCNFISGYAYGTDPMEIAHQHDALMPIWIKIDLLLIFDVEYETTRARLNARQSDENCKIEARGDEFFKLVSDRYKQMLPGTGVPEFSLSGSHLEDTYYDYIERYAKEIKVIDANQSEDDVLKQCLDAISLP